MHTFSRQSKKHGKAPPAVRRSRAKPRRTYLVIAAVVASIGGGLPRVSLAATVNGGGAGGSGVGGSGAGGAGGDGVQCGGQGGGSGGTPGSMGACASGGWSGGHGAGAGGGAGGSLNGSGGAATGGSASGGGGGGVGQVAQTGDVSVSADVTGGRGGDGGNINGPGAGGGGGGGGVGMIFSGRSLTVNSSIHGGVGGFAQIGSGGGGGVGLYFAGTTLTIKGELVGGNGNSGGDGGDGLVVAGNNALVTIAGPRAQVLGGTGNVRGDGILVSGNGNSIDIGQANQLQGYRAIYVTGTGNSIVGGAGVFSYGGPAVEMGGSHNAFELRGGNPTNLGGPDYLFVGNVVSTGTSNVFALGGTINDSFDLSQISATNFTGFSEFVKVGTSTWTVSGTQGNPTPWYIDIGTLKLAATGDLSQALSVTVENSGILDMSGVSPSQTTLKSLGGNATGRVLMGSKRLVISNGLGTGPGQFAGVISGSGGLQVAGGAEILSGQNTYSGGTFLNGGSLSISQDHNLGNLSGALSFGGGTLINTATFTTSRRVTLDAGGGTFQTDANLALVNAVTGSGGLTKTGTGILALLADNTYSGLTSVQSGTLLLTGTNTAAGGVSIDATGTVSLGDGGFSGSVGGAIVDNGTLVFNRSGNFTHGGAISGSGAINQTGPGVTTLSGNSAAFSGSTTVSAGTLLVDGTLGGTVTVAAAGTLGGEGTIGGNTTVLGALQGGTGHLLSFGSNLTLTSGSNVNVLLGADGSTPLFDVAGNLTIDGTLNIRDAGGFSPGLYRLFDYAGTLTDNGLQIGTTPVNVPASDLSIDTHVTNQVNLLNTGGAALNFWDGAINHNNGSVDGGNGIWNPTNDNWTTSTGAVNAAWHDGEFAIFEGTAGTVTVDGGGSGISVGGMQFATDGYQLVGDPITLGLAQTIIRVGVGSRSATPTATIASALTGSGGLEKADYGTLVLSGVNSYTGGTTIDQGTLSVSSDQNLGASTGALTLDGGRLENTAAFTSARTVTLGSGGGEFQTDANLTLTGTLGGSGFLTKTGTGTLTLTSDNTYAGGTQISGGALQLGNGGNTGSLVGNVENNGQLIVDRANTWTFSGQIGGAGSLVQAGTGTTVLTGNSDYSGGTTIAAGTLQVGNGGTSGSIVGDIADNGTLAFNRSGDLALSGRISGAGAIRQTGAGTTYLSGDSSTFSGATTVSAGTLAVDGTLGGTVAVLAGGTLAGVGTVGTTTVAAGATLAPGTPPGYSPPSSLNVNGNVTFAAGSTYAVGIRQDFTSALLNASGKVTLQGGTVSVTKEAGVYLPGSTWTIISAQQGVVGTFDNMVQDLPFVELSLGYDANHVYLNSTRNARSFCSIAGTRNECATGDGVESLGQGNTVYDAVAAQADESHARQALDALSGEAYASLKGVLLDDSQFVRDAVLGRGRDAFSDSDNAGQTPAVSYADDGSLTTAHANSDRLALWVQPFGAWEHVNGDGNAAALSRSTGGLFLGADLPVAQRWRVGLMVGTSNTNLGVNERGSSASSSNYHLALYGGSQWGPIGLRFGAGYTWHTIAMQRSAVFPSFAENLGASYKATTMQAFGEAGYRIDTPLATVEPFVNLAYVNLRSDGFSESGGAAALQSEADNSGAIFTTMGVRGSQRFAIRGREVTAYGSAGWRHAEGDVVPLSTFSFAGGSAFTIAGPHFPRDALTIKAGVSVKLNRSVNLGINYAGLLSTVAHEHSVNLTLAAPF